MALPNRVTRRAFIYHAIGDPPLPRRRGMNDDLYDGEGPLPVWITGIVLDVAGGAVMI